MIERIAMKTLAGAAAVLGLTLVAGTAFAFGGCVDSPENPTWILTGLGAAAAGAPWLYAKLKHRRDKRDQ